MTQSQISSAQAAAYVQPAGGEIPEREPPMAAEGAVAWARANLFGNVTDTLITLFLAIFILWASWSALSSFVFRANVEGVTQGEGTMARVVAELDAELDRAAQMEAAAADNAAALIAEQQRDLQDLARRISVLDLTSLETETRLGLTRRVLPAAIDERFTIAQSKLPLSRVIELELLKRQLIDPRTEQTPDLATLEAALSLEMDEQDALVRGSAPWHRGSDVEKVLFQSTLSDARKIINQAVTTDAGKVYAPLAEVRVSLDGLLTELVLDGNSVSASDLLERPTRPALQFNGLVDGVMGTPLTTIPVSRLQKIRKDSLTPDQIRDLRADLAVALVDETQPGLSGLRRNKAIEAAALSLTDAVLFLNRDMPQGYDDPLPPALLKALDQAEFWPAAHVLAEPRRFLPVAQDTTQEAENTTRGSLDPNSATSSDGLTTPQKVPLVIAAMAQPGAPEGSYATMISTLSDAYTAQDIAGMRAALEGLDPITQWARGNNGANWAVIKQNFWPRMIIGTYPVEKLWRVVLVLLGLFVAVAPLLVPACRTRPFYIFAGIYPLFLLFMLSGLAIRFYGFHGAEDGAGIFGQLYSEQGRVLQAAVMLYIIFMVSFLQFQELSIRKLVWSMIILVCIPTLVLILMLFNLNVIYEVLKSLVDPELALTVLARFIIPSILIVIMPSVIFYGCWYVRKNTEFGKTAGPALLVGQVLAAGYFVIMIWGTIINPEAAQKNVLVESNFVGLLTADHPLGKEIDPANVQAQIDDLNAQAEAPGISEEQATALRTQAFALKPALGAAASAQRDFENVVAEGEGTFVILPHAPSLEWGGLLVTMVLGVVGMAASLPIGIVLAFGRQSTLPIIRWFSTGLIEITRGVPLIALLLIVTFVLPKLLPPGTEYPKLGLVLLAICLFGGVYQAEVIRGGLQALPKGQFEAAQAMGLTFWQESRLVTLPQALKAVIPAIVNTFIGLFKDTTLVIVVGIVDLLTIVEFQITAENAWNTTKPEALIVVSLMFFALMFSLSRYSIWLEKRLATGHR